MEVLNANYITESFPAKIIGSSKLNNTSDFQYNPKKI
jgi:hypothetical protein